MARDSQKMGLHSWSSLPDPYNYQQLDQNWQILDFHDHTPGRGVPIPMGGIAPAAVGTTQLADGAVTDAKIAIGTLATVVNQPGDLIISAAPTRAGCLLCNGATFDPVQYNHLFDAIGTGYGVDPITNQPFLPDFRGRVIIGAGTGTGLTTRHLGDYGGQQTHLLLAAESGFSGWFGATGLENQFHNHNVGTPTDFASAADKAAFAADGGSGGTTGTQNQFHNHFVNIPASDASSRHQNMQPFGVANVLIKY